MKRKSTFHQLNERIIEIIIFQFLFLQGDFDILQGGFKRDNGAVFATDFALVGIVLFRGDPAVSLDFCVEEMDFFFQGTDVFEVEGRLL